MLARHGARLVADPHPEQNFFKRSDNYSLARRGSSPKPSPASAFTPDYHQPSDEISRIDFPHMTRAIASMVAPIEWLAQTSWKPQWLAEWKAELILCRHANVSPAGACFLAKAVARRQETPNFQPVIPVAPVRANLQSRLRTSHFRILLNR